MATVQNRQASHHRANFMRSQSQWHDHYPPVIELIVVRQRRILPGFVLDQPGFPLLRFERPFFHLDAPGGWRGIKVCVCTLDARKASRNNLLCEINKPLRRRIVVPNARRLVLRCCDDVAPVRTERCTTYFTGVSLKNRDGVPGCGVPETCALVLRCCDHPSAIRTEFCLCHDSKVADQRMQGLIGHTIPDAGGSVIRRCDRAPSVRSKGSVVHCVDMAAINRDRLSAVGVPDARRFVC